MVKPSEPVRWNEISPQREAESIGSDEYSWNKPGDRAAGGTRAAMTGEGGGMTTQHIFLAIFVSALFILGAMGAVSTLATGVPSVETDSGRGYWGEVTSR